MDVGFRIVAAAERAPAWLDSPERPFERISLSPLPDERAHDLLRRRLSGLYDWDEAALVVVVSSGAARDAFLLACASAAVEQMLGAGRIACWPSTSRQAADPAGRSQHPERGEVIARNPYVIGAFVTGREHYGREALLSTVLRASRGTLDRRES